MTADVQYPGILPLPDEQSEPYWSAARQHRLVVQRCEICGRLRFPPSRNCPWCASEELSWVQTSGTGTVFSFIWIHQAFLPRFADQLPYNVVEVALDDDESVLMTGNVVGLDKQQLRIGLPVRVHFDAVDPDITLVRWQPRKESH